MKQIGPNKRFRYSDSAISNATLLEKEAFRVEEARGERKNRFGDPDQHKIRYRKRIKLAPNPFDKKV